MIDIKNKIQEHKQAIDALDDFLPDIDVVAKQMIASIGLGGKIIWMGNGGSAADAQHFAAELVGRFKLERPAIASIALTTDTSIITAIANDYDFNQIFSRQIEALCGKDDVVVAISTSGSSANVIKAVEVAKGKGAYVVGLLGKDGGKLKDMVDVPLVVSSKETARIQEAHVLIGHILCELVEDKLFNNR